MDLLTELKRIGVRFVSGVPDSTLQAFCWSVFQDPEIEHVPAACEGGAIALASGHWIATGRLPCVYLQNSGLPNALNPLMALASTEVFDIPMILLVGWRGGPGFSDEPQHSQIGRETIALLQSAGIAPLVIETAAGLTAVRSYLDQIPAARRRGAILLSPIAMKAVPVASTRAPVGRAGLRKADVLATLLAEAEPRSLFVSGIGHTARELMALRQQRGEDEFSDLPAVGGMGFASAIAAGLALGRPDRRIYCVDGDGAFLMHAGNHAVVGAHPGLPLTHIVLDNGCHASVGGHPVVCVEVNHVGVAQAFGYPWATTVATLDALAAALRTQAARGGAGFIHVPVVAEEPPANLPRPSRPLRDALAIVGNGRAQLRPT